MLSVCLTLSLCLRVPVSASHSLSPVMRRAIAILLFGLATPIRTSAYCNAMKSYGPRTSKAFAPGWNGLAPTPFRQAASLSRPPPAHTRTLTHIHTHTHTNTHTRAHTPAWRPRAVANIRTVPALPVSQWMALLVRILHCLQSIHDRGCD